MTTANGVTARGSSWDSGGEVSDQQRQSLRSSRERDDVQLLRNDSTSQRSERPETISRESNRHTLGRESERHPQEKKVAPRSYSLPRRGILGWDGVDLSLQAGSDTNDEKRAVNVAEGLLRPPRIQHTRGRSSPGPYRTFGNVWGMPSQSISSKREPDSSSPTPTNELSDPPHHIFTRKQKKVLVYMVSTAAIFSPLSSNIYFPAVDTIAKVLHTPIDFIALSITIYMLFQGIAPSFWGPLADTYGRRPILISTLFVYIVANLGLAVSKSYASLMVFRGFQAIGSSATIAIGAGVIGDISVASERGGFMGLFGGIRMFGQAVGPVIGGALTEYGGFRSIFWTLLGLASLVVIFLILFLPETLRKIAGDGSQPLYGIYKPVYKLLKRTESVHRDERYCPEKPTWREMVDSFRLLGETDVFVTLLFGGIIYAVWSMITSSTSTLFKKEYQLSDVMIGLIFFPNGLGCVLGSLATGKLMDRDYKRAEVRYRTSKGLAADAEIKNETHPDFPLERARLGQVWWMLLLFCISTGVYGYSTEWHIAVPLIMQFIAAFTATSIFNMNSTLMIDLYPAKPATATAINNLVRCTLGAIGVGCVERSMAKINEGPTFGILAGISGLSGLLVVVELLYGPRWRKGRMQHGRRSRGTV